MADFEGWLAERLAAEVDAMPIPTSIGVSRTAGRRPVRRRAVLASGAAAAVIVVVAGGVVLATRGSSPERSATVAIKGGDTAMPLPTFSPPPGSIGALGGLVTGVLVGDPTLDGGCVYMRDANGDNVTLVWPLGYTVRFAPNAEVLDASGKVVLNDGDRFSSGGGLWSGPTPSRCVVSSTAYVLESPERVTGSPTETPTPS